MVKAYGMTDIGLRRETNQDVFSLYEQDGCCIAVVCDGMGGQNGGYVASELACKTVSESLAESLPKAESEVQIQKAIVTAVREANSKVFQAAAVMPYCKGMGTTVVVAVVKDGQVQLAHVGDSRAYLLHNGSLRQLTRDHSLVQELMDRGELTPEQAAVHPNKHMITRAVGVTRLVEADVLSFSMSPGDKLLLCTDGLTNMVNDRLIHAALESQIGQEICEMLVALANQAGGVDNITVAVIE